MRIKIAMFAAAREVIGSNSLELTLDQPATVADLKRALSDRFPQLIPLLTRSVFSVDQEFANDDCALSESAQIAMIPPVSGG